MDHLYDYQKKAVNFLEESRRKSIKGAILSLKMGLGKTLISLAFSQRFEKTLVICEKSNIQTCVNEIKKFMPEDTGFIVLHGDFIKDPKSYTQEDLEGYDIIITTFEFVASCLDDGVRCYKVKIPRVGRDGDVQPGIWTENDIERNNENDDNPKVKKHMVVKNKTLESERPNPITSRKWNMIVVDEVAKIVNSDTKNSRAIASLWADFYLVLSGTPMINYSKDLYSIFRFLGLEIPSSHFNLSLFKSEKLISYIYFLTYEEAGIKLPELREHTINVKLTKEEEEIQKIIIKKLSDDYLQFKRGDVTFSAPLRMFLQLRMFLTYPHMLTEGKSDISYFEEHPMYLSMIQDPDFIGSKMKVILHKIKDPELRGKKILIFSQFIKCLKRIRKILKESDDEYLNSLDTAVLFGETDVEDRKALVDMLNNGQLDILLIQIKVGSSGLNIQKADAVFIVEPFYNVATELQAIARAHRTGREKAVDVYRFLIENSFEYYILDIQHRKEREKMTFLGGESTFEKSFSREIIDFIVSGKSQWRRLTK